MPHFDAATLHSDVGKSHTNNEILHLNTEMLYLDADYYRWTLKEFTEAENVANDVQLLHLHVEMLRNF